MKRRSSDNETKQAPRWPSVDELRGMPKAHAKSDVENAKPIATDQPAAQVKPRGRPFEKGNAGRPKGNGVRLPNALDAIEAAEKGASFEAPGNASEKKRALVVRAERVERSEESPAPGPLHIAGTYDGAPRQQPSTFSPPPVTGVLQPGDALEVARLALVRESRGLYRRSLRLLREAEGLVQTSKKATVVDAEVVKARASALQASAVVAKQVQSFAELLARLEGLLRSGSTTNIAIAYVQSPEWRRLKSRLLAALEPYPEALEAVGRALE